MDVEIVVRIKGPEGEVIFEGSTDLNEFFGQDIIRMYNDYYDVVEAVAEVLNSASKEGRLQTRLRRRT